MDNENSYQSTSMPARAVRLGEEPTLSVVVTSRGSRDQLEAWLRGLVSRCREETVEIVVVRTGDAEDLDAFRRAYPEVRFASARTDASPAELRVLGMRAADGDIVVFREDDVISDEWLTDMRSRQQN